VANETQSTIRKVPHMTPEEERQLCLDYELCDPKVAELVFQAAKAHQKAKEEQSSNTSEE